jgi:hypothetical protein
MTERFAIGGLRVPKTPPDHSWVGGLGFEEPTANFTVHIF